MSEPPGFPPPPSDPEPPLLLDSAVVADDEALAAAVDTFIAAEPEARARLHEIADQQELLRQCADAGLWRMILAVDEAIVERWAELVVKIARWAFEGGRRHPLCAEVEASSSSSRALVEPPRLDVRTAADESALDDALGALADGDIEYRSASRDVLRLQGRLRALVTETAWGTYLELEVATNSRDANFDRVVALWAFTEGVRSGARRRGGA
jgi:hypothetical protein